MSDGEPMADRAREEPPRHRYSDEHTPLGSYAGIMATWAAVHGGLLAAAGRTGRLPERVDAGDIVILGVATHKLARIITKDWVTSPLRAPFVRYEGSAGGGEVKEKAVGRGPRKAVGDLLTCAFCIGPWVAGALTAGFVAAPRATRLVAAGFSAVTISDFLHQAYQKLRSA